MFKKIIERHKKRMKIIDLKIEKRACLTIMQEYPDREERIRKEIAEIDRKLIFLGGNTDFWKFGEKNKIWKI